MIFWVLVGMASALAADPLVIKVNKPVAHGEFRTGVGSPITFDLPGRAGPREGVFLGQLRSPNGSVSAYMILDPQRETVYYSAAASTEIAESSLEQVVDLYAQAGETCTGYAIDHYLQQLHLTGFRGTGKLAKTLSTEEGRTNLLVDTVNQYYLVTQHRYSIRAILNKYGETFGFHCEKKNEATSEGARAYILRRLRENRPVIISFNIGPDMVDSAYRLTDLGGRLKHLDRRLWLPRRIGQRNSGGHTIVAVATFELAGKPQVLVLDSDWDQPRIWDLETAFAERTASAEVDLVSCWD